MSIFPTVNYHVSLILESRSCRTAGSNSNVGHSFSLFLFINSRDPLTFDFLSSTLSHTGNSWHPLFNQVDDVSIYLFNGDSGQQIGHWVENKRQGSIQINANDTFWGAAGSQIQPGHNQSFPFYFVILPTTATVHQGESTEPAFTGIRKYLFSLHHMFHFARCFPFHRVAVLCVPSITWGKEN